MKNNFDLKKFLSENKLTTNSKMGKEDVTLNTTTEDVDISVTIKNNKLIDDYKVQEYIKELGELIQNHINKGNLAKDSLSEEEANTAPSDAIHQVMLSYIKPEVRDKYAKDYNKYFNFLKASSNPLSGPNRPQVWVKFLKDLVKNKVTTLDKLNTFSEKYNDGREGIEGLAGYLHKQGNVKHLMQIDNL